MEGACMGRRGAIMDGFLDWIFSHCDLVYFALPFSWHLCDSTMPASRWIEVYAHTHTHTIRGQ